MNKQIDIIRELMEWIRINVGKSVNFTVNHWTFNTDGSQITEYKLWVEGLISKTTETIEEFINLIPSIKQYCELNMEFSA